MRGGDHALLGSDNGSASTEHINVARSIRSLQRPFDSQFELFRGMSTQQSVVPGHEMDLITTCCNAVLDAIQYIRCMAGDDVAKGEHIVEIPGTVDRNAFCFQLLQIVQDSPDDAYVLAESLFIGCVPAIGVVKVYMKPRTEVDGTFVSRFHTASMGTHH
ncbi:hypothetical protein SDC9_139686 [bioreactor metagenome]|uniref:Uncharacterized protein n=1 Tax=bioreactor metagenome TaxID=1076179 RepID=A0A645DTA1_9ZZZZ